MISISWETIGDPAPQGSKRHVGNGIMVESSKKLPVWREQLINDIAHAADGCVFDSAIQVTLIFKFPRLKSNQMLLSIKRQHQILISCVVLF